MARPVTLFTGQWADLPLEDLAAKCGGWGFDGLELACWGDHFEVSEALSRQRLLRGAARDCSSATASTCWAIGNHLVGQAVCDPIDDAPPGRAAPESLGRRRPRGRAPTGRRGDEGHRARGRAARRHGGHRLHRLARSGTCSTRSRPTTGPRSSAATRTSRSAGARSSTSSTPRACASRSRSIRPRSPTTSPPRARRWRRSAPREGFGINFDPSPLRAPVPRLGRLHRRVRRPHLPRARQGRRAGGSTAARRSSARTSTSASPSAAGTSSPRATATSTSRTCSARSTAIGYDGPLSIEWEDSGMDREWGAQDALGFVRRTDFSPSVGRLRRGVREGGVMSEGSASPRRGGRPAAATRSRSASGCSATRSWARRTPTPTRSSPT